MEHDRFLREYSSLKVEIKCLFTSYIFLVWVQYSGLELSGEVDITEARFLCDKHFSGNYISNQARRKMLVHTAIPEKWNIDVDDEVENPPFKIIGCPPEKRRKLREYSAQELVSKPEISLKFPPTVLNKESASRTSIFQESFEDDESQGTEDQTEETFNIQETGVKSEPYYEKNKKLTPTQKVQYILVQPKAKPAEQLAKMSTTVVRNLRVRPQVQQAEIQEDEETCIVEDPDISSNNIEILESEPKVDESPSPQTSKKSEDLENYSEFIFAGEKYVQMPKRVFEAEKEKIRKESEKYKLLLRKLNGHLNKMDLD